MPDQPISGLPAASQINALDLFVLEQDAVAKKLAGQLLLSWLTAAADGHGGISSWSYTPPVAPSLQGTLTLTLADTTVINVPIMNGAKGDTGDAWFIHIRYASDLPSADSDMSIYPDNYIGIYSGTSETAPTAYTAYTWFKWKGETGAPGAAATILTQAVEYMASTSGTVVPEGSWTTTIPTVPPSYYLWTRTRLTYNDGTVVTSYAVSRNGQDGSGSVSSVNGITPAAGSTNVELKASDIPTGDSTSVQAHLTSIENDVSTLQTYEVRHISGNITALPKSFSYAFITAEHRVINVELGNPAAFTSDLGWTTAEGEVTFTGTMANLQTSTIEFDIVRVVTP